MNIINDFWNGKIKLWKSYWIVGELLNALFILLIFNIEVRLLNNRIIENFLPFFNFNDFSFFSKIILIFEFKFWMDKIEFIKLTITLIPPSHVLLKCIVNANLTIFEPFYILV